MASAAAHPTPSAGIPCSRIPKKRLGEPGDFVGIALYLLSAASDFVTGQVIYVDGGYTAT